MKICFFILLFTLAVTAPVHAQNQSGLIGVYGDWSAFAAKENGKPVCHIGSEPIKQVGKYKKRGETFMLVTHRPAENVKAEVSLRAGYTYKPGSDVTVTIGKKKFFMFTQGGDAWARDAKADWDIVTAMVRGASMTINGVSSRDTKTTDTYSLKGFTAAYKEISKACNVK